MQMLAVSLPTCLMLAGLPLMLCMYASNQYLHDLQMTMEAVAEGVEVDIALAVVEVVDMAVAGQSLLVVEAVAEVALLAGQGTGLALAAATTALLASMTTTLHAKHTHTHTHSYTLTQMWYAQLQTVLQSLLCLFQWFQLRSSAISVDCLRQQL